MIRRIAHSMHRPVARLSDDDRRSLPGLMFAVKQSGRQGGQAMLIGQIQPGRIAPLRAIKIAR